MIKNKSKHVRAKGTGMSVISSMVMALMLCPWSRSQEQSCISCVACVELVSLLRKRLYPAGRTDGLYLSSFIRPLDVALEVQHLHSEGSSVTVLCGCVS